MPNGGDQSDIKNHIFAWMSKTGIVIMPGNPVTFYISFQIESIQFIPDKRKMIITLRSYEESIGLE